MPQRGLLGPWRAGRHARVRAVGGTGHSGRSSGTARTSPYFPAKPHRRIRCPVRCRCQRQHKHQRHPQHHPQRLYPAHAQACGSSAAEPDGQGTRVVNPGAGATTKISITISVCRVPPPRHHHRCLRPSQSRNLRPHPCLGLSLRLMLRQWRATARSESPMESLSMSTAGPCA